MELFDSKTKCKYAVYGTGFIKTGEKGIPGDKVVYLIDLKLGNSISNNIDEISEEISKYYPGYRIAYRDSFGSWGEILVLDNKFRRFGNWYPNWRPDDDEVEDKIKVIKDKINKVK